MTSFQTGISSGGDQNDGRRRLFVQKQRLLLLLLSLLLEIMLLQQLLVASVVEKRRLFAVCRLLLLNFFVFVFDGVGRSVLQTAVVRGRQRRTGARFAQWSGGTTLMDVFGRKRTIDVLIVVIVIIVRCC